MRLPLACLALLLVGGSIARADIYNFNFTGSDLEEDGLGIPNSYTEVFNIDTSAIVPPSGSDGFFCADPADNCFVAGSAGLYYTVYRNGVIAESSDIGETPFATFAYSTNSDKLTALPLFTGLSTSPVLTTGTYYAYYDSGVSYNPEGPVTITDLSDAPVPEPGTLALLGTGVLGMAVTIRRRVRA